MTGMGYIAVYDVGTTAVKAALTREDGSLLATATSEPMPLHDADGRQEQDPDDWDLAFRNATRTVFARAAQADAAFTHGIGSSAILGVIMSGQMQDVIALDEHLLPVRPAILYSDGRARAQARRIADAVGNDAFASLSGNRAEGSLPLAKLMWLAEHEPRSWSRVRHVLFDAKDYLVARLTGVPSGDTVACSTSGAMNIVTRRWDDRLVSPSGVDPALLPALHAPDERIGVVTPDAAARYSLPAGTPVYAGIGDAGATTLASGVTRPGDYNINLGTSGWIAAVSKASITDRPGVANLAYLTPDTVINGVPFLNAGNVHRWSTSVFAKDYPSMTELLARSVPGSNGVRCLPYLAGERFPVMNEAVRGAFVGITPETTAADLARATLEGVAFSIAQGLASLPDPPAEITLVGGGARERLWCQIMADVLDHEVTVVDNADIMPAMALSALVLRERGALRSLDHVSRWLRERRTGERYVPDPQDARAYRALAEGQRALYPAMAGLYARPDSQGASR